MKLFYSYISLFLILLTPLSFAQNLVNVEFANNSDDNSPNELNNVKLMSASENKKSSEFIFKVVSLSDGTEKVYSEQKVSKLSKINLSLERGTYKFYVS
ncbi:MAG: hypothetical protein KKE71_05905, partial [Nanoarchaeota archaeon]|nr:hypothetical protein [Nanoarchaeota archaeon]